MEEIKYPAIELIRSIYRFVGWFIIFITLITIVAGFIAVLVNQQFIGGGLFGFLGSILGAVWGSFVAISREIHACKQPQPEYRAGTIGNAELHWIHMKLRNAQQVGQGEGKQ
jgi:hypothetical protein